VRLKTTDLAIRLAIFFHMKKESATCSGKHVPAHRLVIAVTTTCPLMIRPLPDDVHALINLSLYIVSICAKLLINKFFRFPIFSLIIFFIRFNKILIFKFGLFFFLFSIIFVSFSHDKKIQSVC